MKDFLEDQGFDESNDKGVIDFKEYVSFQKKVLQENLDIYRDFVS